ncbi:restriction endonuclease subunit S [Parasutterella sp.]|uniref:restriction endonuclease subunit S n=1 Tax=Parasutterella sp. TaxID=2049037 RepID=UPI003AEF28A4
MEKKEKAPVLRFKDTNGKDYPAWEQRKLEELASKFTGGGTPNTSNPNYWNGEIPWIQSSDLKEDDVLSLTVKKHISQEGLENSAAKIVPKNSLVIVTRVGVGKLVVNNQEIATSQDFLSLSGIKGDSRFLAYSLYSLLKKNSRRVQGTSIKGITKVDFLKETILIPSLEEQEKISSCMVEIDKLITLHQRKLEALKKLKRTLLQKMFPKKGHLKPELRFFGFTNDWEQHKLGDLGHTYGGLSGKSKQDFGHGDARFVTYMNVFSNPIGDPCMVDSIEIDDRQSRVRKGDVLFTTSSETPDEVGMSCVWPSDSENLYLNSFCFGYRPTTKINSNFLASLLRSPSVREKIIFLAQGISRYNISKNKVMEISIPLPSEEEQSQIGDFFTQLDKTITLHQRKLEIYKKLKKGLLQKMFI